MQKVAKKLDALNPVLSTSYGQARRWCGRYLSPERAYIPRKTKPAASDLL